jgi:hypothetical protein
MADVEKTVHHDSKEQQVEVMAIENLSQTAAPVNLNDAEAATSDSAQRKAEALLVRRIDMLILPLLALSIMVGYLDRSNIGNARILGSKSSLRFCAPRNICGSCLS